MIRLIASDLDGTLLDSQGRLPDGVFPCIEALAQRGIRFAAASGRQYGNLRRLFQPVADQMDFICENGSLVVAGGQKQAHWIPRDMAEEIMADIQRAGMELLISAPDTCYVLSSSPRAYTDDIVYRLRNTVTVIDDPRAVAAGCMKLSGYHSQGVADRARPLQGKWRNRLYCDIAGREWLDFTLTNKGTGIAALAESLHIPLSDTAAFGDQFNDESMLDRVGYPFIMETAPAPLLRKGYTPCRDVLAQLQEMLAAGAF